MTRSQRGAKKVRARVQHRLSLRSPSQKIIARMTNWQRNQWAKTGYDPKKLKKCAKLDRAKVLRQIHAKG